MNHFRIINTLSRSSGLLRCGGQNRQFSSSESIAGVWTALSQSAPVAALQNGLIELHDASGLPWWATIIVSTFALRTAVTLPLAVYQNRNMAKFEKVATIDLPEISKQLKQETAIAVRKFNWTEEEARKAFTASVGRGIGMDLSSAHGIIKFNLLQLRVQYSKLIIKENCHPAKSMVILLGQIPLWIIQSMSIRNLISLMPNPDDITAQVAYTELTVGGFLWIPNLTQVDASFILPVALGVINLTIIECQTRMRTRMPGKWQKITTNLFRGLSVLMVPIACTVPAVSGCI